MLRGPRVEVSKRVSTIVLRGEESLQVHVFGGVIEIRHGEDGPTIYVRGDIPVKPMSEHPAHD